MKKLVFVFALVAMSFGGSAFAQFGWQDNIGIYFDAEATMASNNDGLVGVKHVYLVFTKLTNPTIEGFECKITGSGGLLVVYDSIAFPVNAIDVGTRLGEIIVGFASPLMAMDRQVVAMEFDVIVTDPSVPGMVFIDPVYFPSLPNTSAYLTGGEIVAARNSTAPGLPVLVTNSTEEPVATQGTSFDNLKSLYR